MTVSRPFWQAIEVIHDVVYFAPDSKQRYEAIGLKGYWMGYVASRSAALGTPPPEVVIAHVPRVRTPPDPARPSGCVVDGIPRRDPGHSRRPRP